MDWLLTEVSATAITEANAGERSAQTTKLSLVGNLTSWCWQDCNGGCRDGCKACWAKLSVVRTSDGGGSTSATDWLRDQYRYNCGESELAAPLARFRSGVI